MVCASTVSGRARSPAPNASKRSRPRRAPCATIAVRFIAPVGLPLVEMGPLPVGAHSKRLARRPPGTTAAGTGKFEARSRPLPRRPRYRAVTSNPDAPRLEESQRGLRILQRRECTFSPKRCNRILRFVRSGSLSGACIAKRLADGILSAIDCVVKLEKKGERGVLTIDAKSLQGVLRRACPAREQTTGVCLFGGHRSRRVQR